MKKINVTFTENMKYFPLKWTNKWSYKNVKCFVNIVLNIFVNRFQRFVFTGHVLWMWWTFSFNILAKTSHGGGFNSGLLWLASEI